MTEITKEVIGIIVAVTGCFAGVFIGRWISNRFFDGAYAPMFITYLLILGLFVGLWHVISKRIKTKY